MRRVLWVTSSGLSFAAFLVVIVRFLAGGPPNRLAEADSLASVLSLFLSTAFGIISVWAAVRATRSDEGAMLDRAAAEVARAVDRQWRDEAHARGLTGSEPLLVTWSQTERPVIADAGTTPWAPGAARDGVVAESVSLWRALPRGELVIIGAPGAGKTSMAVLLVIGLLAEAVPTDPVPALIGLSFWDGVKPLLDWIPETVARQVNRSRFDAETIRRLMNRRRILPVLDGLDELTREHQVQALEGLQRLSAEGIPFVLTSRADEFEWAVFASGEPLARAAIVEVQPIAATTAVHYLVAGQLEARRRWAEVKAELESNPDGLTARVLSTPLMIYLARTAFRSVASEPRKIVACESEEQAEKLLFDTYFESLYSTPNRPSADQTRRWLAFLAEDARKYKLDGLDDLRLFFAAKARRWLLYCARAALVGGLTAIVVGFPFWLGIGEVPAVIVGAAAGASIFVGNIDDDLVNLNNLLAAAGLVVIGVIISLGQAIGWVLLLQLALGVPALAGLVLIAVGALNSGRRDKLTLTGLGLMLWPLGAIAIWLYLGVSFHLTDVSFKLVDGYEFARQWIVRLLIRGKAFLRGQLPLLLMRFLLDAHRRGVLRLSATRYELRHDRLHDYLADQSGSRS